MLGERRQSPRWRSYLPIRLRQPGTRQVVETLTRDLGQGGVRCLSPVAFPVTTELQVELDLGGGADTISARARLAWFQTIPDGEQFDLGIAFLDVPAEGQRGLSSFLSRLAEKAMAVSV